MTSTCHYCGEPVQPGSGSCPICRRDPLRRSAMTTSRLPQPLRFLAKSVGYLAVVTSTALVMVIVARAFTL